MSPFVGVGARARKEQPRISTLAAVDSTAPGIAVLDPSISAPLEAFFAGIGVDGQRFLSPDVNGQQTFIAKLSTVGKSNTVYIDLNHTCVRVCHNEKKCQTNGRHDKRQRYFK